MYTFESMENLKRLIDDAWYNRDMLSEASVIDAISQVMDSLDKGELRCAEPDGNGGWKVNEWVKKAVILNFPIQKMSTIEVGPFEFHDKIPIKTGYAEAGVRVVPHAIARYGAYIAPDTILMPSYVNLGAYVDTGTMVDTWATVGSCAQIGKDVHLSGGVGIGGVLEPVQAGPTIIEDGCFIGARSEIVESVIVRKNSVISMGVFIGASTKIIHRETGEIIMGEVPEGSVVVPGALPSKKPGGPSLYCAVIIKTVDEKTRSKTSLNELLRD